MTEQAFDDMGDGAGLSRGAIFRRVRPRHAATLILVRHDHVTPRVLMGRRHGGHDFMPEKWVFPGGRIDPSDYRAPSANELRPTVAERLGGTDRPRLTRALAMAAVRETFEEAGLLLAKPCEPRLMTGPWSDFVGRGAMADLDALDFVARAVTPPTSPKRFDARFFLADAERLLSLERAPDCGELSEIDWVDVGDALALDLPSVTRFVLNDLRARFSDPARPAPFLRFIRGRQQLVHV